MKGGFTEKNIGQPSCYAITSHQDPFIPYHESFCNQTSLAEFPFKDELTCLEINESLINPEASDFSNPPFFQTSEFSELQQLGDSLSSSSMRSLSGGSPEYSVQLPTLGMAPESLIGDDAALTRAMLAVMSTSSCSSSTPNSAINQIWQGHGEVGGGSSKQYSGGVESRNGGMGQEMMMMVMGGEGRMQDGRPTANQLHHMISERRRREKLNDSFSALRTLLPPGTKVLIQVTLFPRRVHHHHHHNHRRRRRLLSSLMAASSSPLSKQKDKASVLAGTIEQMNSLKAQISDLEAKNRTMELSVLSPEDDEKDDYGLNREKEAIKMIRVSEPSSGKQIIELRVTVPADCDMIDLNLHVLECFRERPDLELLSLEGSVYVNPKSAVRMNLLTIRLKGGEEKDEGPFKDALARAIKEALA